MGQPSMALPIETARIEALKKLAGERFGEISPAEEYVLKIAASAEGPEVQAAEGEDRNDIRAGFVRWLATDSDVAANIDPLGIRISDAVITSILNLDSCTVRFPLRFSRCTFQERPTFISTRLPELYLFECRVEHGISAEGIRSQHFVFLGKLQANGELSFGHAKIDGPFTCTGASLNAKGNSIALHSSSISGSVVLNDQFSASGTIRLEGAKIGGSLDCTGATLSATRVALNADQAEIVGSVFLNSAFSCSGTIRLIATQIGVNLLCSGGEFKMLMCQRMRLGGDLIWTGIRKPKKCYLDLIGASVKTFEDDTASWPATGKLSVRGFEYKELTHREGTSEEQIESHTLAPQRKLVADERIQWLKLQSTNDTLDPQPWMRLAKLFKEKDDRTGYRQIICEYRCMKAQTSENPFSRWAWKGMAHLERNPWSILWAFIPLLAIGSLVFWSAANVGMMPPTNAMAYSAWATGKPFPGTYPKFNPLAYTLENELPLVRFGLDDKWAPATNLSSHGKLLLYWLLSSFRICLILAGWVQGVLLTVGINRRFRE